MLVQYLLQKLKTGDSRSINLNALPGRLATRFDIMDFFDIDKSLIDDFFSRLLTQASFKFKINLGNLDIEEESKENEGKIFDIPSTTKKVSKKKRGILLKRLNTIISTEEDQFQEHGVRSFGFGYPLMVKKISRDFGEDKIIVSPIFVWKLTIERIRASKYTYQLSRDDEMGLGLNEVLLSHLETQDHVTISQITDDVVDDGIINKSEMVKIINDILKKCGSTVQHKDLGEFAKIPTSKDELKNFYNDEDLSKPVIFWGGVFGLYRTLKEKIIDDTKKIPEEVINAEENELMSEYKHPYGSVNTDPSQQSVLDSLSERGGMVIQGPPGTGKSQTITAIVTNALDNNKKCLIVCEKKTALEVIKTNLSKVGLGDMCALVEDVYTARKDIVDMVRNKHEHGFGYIGLNYDEYVTTLGDTSKLVTKMNGQRDLLTKDYFNNMHWKSLVGKYLNKNRSFEDQEGLDFFYNSIVELFSDFSREKYDNFVGTIQDGDELFRDWIPSSFLQKIKPSFFSQNKSYMGCKISYDKYLKHLSELDSVFQDSINKFEAILEHNKSIYSNIYTQNQKTNSDFYYDKDGTNTGKHIHCISKNLNIVGDKKQLRKFHTYISTFKKEKVKSAEEVYNISSNHEVIQKSIGKFEKFVNSSQVYNDKICNYHTDIIKNIVNIMAQCKEIADEVKDLLDTQEGAHKLGGLVAFKHTILGPFLKRHKIIHSRHQLIERKYDYLRKHIIDLGYGDISSLLLGFGKYQTLDELALTLEKITETLGHCDFNDFRSASLVSLSYDAKLADGRYKIENVIKQMNGVFNEIMREPIDVELNIISNIYDNKRIFTELFANLESSKHQLEEFYDRSHFYHTLIDEQSLIINACLVCKPGTRSEYFQLSWLKYILLTNDTNALPKNDADILKLYGLINDFKKYQIGAIKAKWKNMATSSMSKLASKGITIQSLYNKRGAPGERRNSLRKIVATDFDLFTNLFPVVLVSPEVCSSIFPLQKGLFDLVIFDEASQLRLEDVMSALFRGNQKIICGDQHQMPPSSFFASSNILLEPTDDDELEEDNEIFTGNDAVAQLANSESLLDYATKKGYPQYMLKVHYRSEHPYLIDFSNHAFYAGRLQPLPNKLDYKPISFYEIDGQLSKGVNEIEAAKVIEVLKDLLSDENIKHKYSGELPTVGIATFNMHQRQYIWDLVQKIKYENAVPELKDKIDNVDLFIKNLDTIQGDERDIIIISTTFAKKEDGKFTQSYGPINQSKGYRLLNVMITRAKKEVHLLTSIPKDVYSHFEERLKISKSDTKHGGSLLHAYINYCKAVSENNNELRLSILEKVKGSEVYNIQDDGLTESPFEEEVVNSLYEIVDPARIKIQYEVGGFRIDVVIFSKKTNKPLIAIECDGATYHSGDMAYCNDIFRQNILEGLGFVFHRIWSTNRWRDRQSEETKLKLFLEELGEL